MSVSKEEVKKIAELARLKFEENELDNFTQQFNKILEYMDKLNELDTENVEPLSHPVEPKENRFRKDEKKPSVKREEALRNAPDSNEEFFKVPKVIKR